MRYRWDPVYPAYVRRTGPTPIPTSGRPTPNATRWPTSSSRHFAEGRLDQAEFKARLDRAMGATTRGDLAGLFDDLPPLADEAPPPRPHRRRLVPFVLLVLLVAAAAGSTLSSIHLPWLLLVWSGSSSGTAGRPRGTTGSARSMHRAMPNRRPVSITRPGADPGQSDAVRHPAIAPHLSRRRAVPA